jgi:hypothetical protein
MCWGSSTPLVEPSGSTPPGNLHPDQIMFPNNGWGLRGCNPIASGNISSNITAKRFNPVVLAEIKLPNSKKYEFKYNQFGEITKVIYPTGSYETFKYEKIAAVNPTNEVYDQANRGVTEHRVYESNGNLVSRTKYAATVSPGSSYKITTIKPKQNSNQGQEPMVEGAKSEREREREREYFMSATQIR